MEPEVGRLRARAARRAKEVKKVRDGREEVCDRRWRVATWIPCFGFIGICLENAGVGAFGIKPLGGGDGATEEEGDEVEIDSIIVAIGVVVVVDDEVDATGFVLVLEKEEESVKKWNDRPNRNKK